MARILVVIFIACLAVACDDRQPAVTVTLATTQPVGGADDVEARIHKIVAEQFGVNIRELKNSQSFDRDLKADELDAVELVLEVEDQFDIKITDAEAEKLLTIGDLVTFVKKKTGR